MKSVNERIIKYRKLANLTQTEMAEKLNIKCSTYSQLERKGIVSADRLFQLAEIFGVTPCQLYKGEEPCKNTTPESSAPTDSETSVLKQPESVKPEKEVFVATRKEQNIIKLIRNFSKPNYDKVMQIIEDIYKEEKNK